MAKWIIQREWNENKSFVSESKLGHYYTPSKSIALEHSYPNRRSAASYVRKMRAAMFHGIYTIIEEKDL